MKKIYEIYDDKDDEEELDNYNKKNNKNKSYTYIKQISIKKQEDKSIKSLIETKSFTNTLENENEFSEIKLYALKDVGLKSQDYIILSNNSYTDSFLYHIFFTLIIKRKFNQENVKFLYGFFEPYIVIKDITENLIYFGDRYMKKCLSEKINIINTYMYKNEGKTKSQILSAFNSLLMETPEDEYSILLIISLYMRNIVLNYIYHYYGSSLLKKNQINEELINNIFDLKYNFSKEKEDLILKIFSSCFEIQIDLKDIDVELSITEDKNNLAILKFNSKKKLFYFGLIDKFFQKEYDSIKDNDLNENEENIIKKLKNSLN